MMAGQINPLANPLNTRRFGNYSLDNSNTRSFFRKTDDPSKLTVPDTAADSQKKLETPHINEFPQRPSLDLRGYSSEWEKVETVDTIIKQCEEEKIMNSSSSISKTEYQKYVEEQDRILKDNMTEEQKQLMKEFEAGQIVRLSKLKDE